MVSSPPSSPETSMAAAGTTSTCLPFFSPGIVFGVRMRDRSSS
jgi:hypothetical protein